MCDCCSSEKDIYLPELATITKAEMMNQTEMFMHLEFDSGKELGHEAGHFVEGSSAGSGEAPISVSSSPTRKGFDLVIRNVGRVTKAKNIDMSPRQSHGEINTGGIKVKVLGENSSDFKFKIKNKNK